MASKTAPHKTEEKDKASEKKHISNADKAYPECRLPKCCQLTWRKPIEENSG